jgi:hypothetical protein
MRDYINIVRRLVISASSDRRELVLYGHYSFEKLREHGISEASYLLSIDNRENLIRLHIDDDQTDLRGIVAIGQQPAHDIRLLRGALGLEH